MRVLNLASSGEIGGGNRYLETLWRGLRPLGVEVSVVCPTAGPMAKLCAQMSVPVEIAAYGQPSLRQPLATVEALRSQLAVLKRVQPDIIHANDLLNARSFSLAAAIRRIPMLCHVHYHPDAALAGWAFRRLPKPRVFVHNSNATYSVTAPALFKHCPQSRQLVVHNCIELDRYAPPKERTGRTGRPRRIAIIANLIPVKGHLEFLEMASELSRLEHRAEYWIVGDELYGSGYRAKLEKRTSELHLESAVKFLGFRTDVPSLLQQVDILVCASHEEPFGLSLAEAMACEVPVVATRVGGIPEVVDEGTTGLLVEAKSVPQLVEAVATLLVNETLRHKMGIAGRNRVEKKFSLQHHATKIYELYAQLRTPASPLTS